MNPDEYLKLDRLEKEHWFYAGKREIVRYWIQKLHPLLPGSFLVDCGAGTGCFAAEMQSICNVLAVDDHEESLRIATANLGSEHVRRGSCLALPVPEVSVDCLTALDVLEHVENDSAAIAEFSRVIRPGGIVVITVPALQALWSDWDLSLHHWRRYNRQSFLRLLTHPLFALEHWNFINVLALPAIYLSRKLRAITGASGRAEDVIPPKWLNVFLRKTFTGLANQEQVRFPFGVGLLAVLRRISSLSQ
jgi:SAM-dependent methyltransferase